MVGSPELEVCHGARNVKEVGRDKIKQSDDRPPDTQKRWGSYALKRHRCGRKNHCQNQKRDLYDSHYQVDLNQLSPDLAQVESSGKALRNPEISQHGQQGRDAEKPAQNRPKGEDSEGPDDDQSE